jgi:hypothetical protein
MCTPRISSGSGVRNPSAGTAARTGVSTIDWAPADAVKSLVSPKTATAPDLAAPRLATLPAELGVVEV